MAKLMVYENSGKWATALRRTVPQPIAIVESRSLADVFAELDQASADLVAVEIVRVRIDISLQAVGQIAARFPHAFVVALAERGLAAYESLLREAGAVHVVFSSRQVGEIGAIAGRRLAAKPNNDFNAEELTLEEQIAARLPWRK